MGGLDDLIWNGIGRNRMTKKLQIVSSKYLMIPSNFLHFLSSCIFVFLTHPAILSFYFISVIPDRSHVPCGRLYYRPTEERSQQGSELK